VSITLPSLIFRNGVQIDPSAIGVIVAKTGKDQFIVHFPTGPAQVSRFILKPAADTTN
jgi:hypothetical protein